MMIVLAVAIILMIIFDVRLYRGYKKHLLISDLADRRRELLHLIRIGAVDPRSELFKKLYSGVEVLIRTHYFNIKDLLLSAEEAVESVTSGSRYQSIRPLLVREVEEILSREHGDEARRFLIRYAHTVRRAVLRNQFGFLLYAVGTLATSIVRTAGLRWVLLFLTALKDLSRLSDAMKNRGGPHSHATA